MSSKIKSGWKKDLGQVLGSEYLVETHKFLNYFNNHLVQKGYINYKSYDPWRNAFQLDFKILSLFKVTIFIKPDDKSTAKTAWRMSNLYSGILDFVGSTWLATWIYLVYTEKSCQKLHRTVFTKSYLFKFSLCTQECCKELRIHLLLSSPCDRMRQFAEQLFEVLENWISG